MWGPEQKQDTQTFEIEDTFQERNMYLFHVFTPFSMPQGQHLELRQQLSRCKWRLAPNLPSPWDQAGLEVTFAKSWQYVKILNFTAPFGIILILRSFR